MAPSGSFTSSPAATKGSHAAALLCARLVSAPKRADHRWGITPYSLAPAAPTPRTVFSVRKDPESLKSHIRTESRSKAVGLAACRMIFVHKPQPM